MDTTVERARRICGTLNVPGDKSIAHRALILGALASGRQIIEGLPPSEDVGQTARCLRALGCSIEEVYPAQVAVSAKEWVKEQKLFSGNSATTARLLSGLVAGKGIHCTIDGDESLRRRPMSRIAGPLVQMGARVQTAPGGFLPMEIHGGNLCGITYRMPVASAQVKSAILIAGLHARGRTTVIEKTRTRDHTENLLSAMGVPVERCGSAVTVPGGAHLQGIRVSVPGDISSASFFIVAAALLPGSEVCLPRVGINPTRTGALEVLRKMGANITLEDVETRAGEAAACVRVQSSSLRGIEIGESLVPALIDELPVLAVAATQAEGVTIVRGAGELRYKESDRILAIVRNLSILGAEIEELKDGFVVHGPCRLKGSAVSSQGDHRIAMAMAVAGLVAEGRTKIEDSGAVSVSYPDFFRDLSALVS